MPDYRRMMWFGNRTKMAWVPMPQVDRPANSVGWSGGGTFIGGGAFTKRSVSTHKTYEMNFGLRPRDEARVLTDFYEGVHGPGPFYWTDPMWMDKNVLPQSWATPSLAAADAVPLEKNRVRPTLVATPANTKDLPSQSAVYTLSQTSANAPKLWIPIPPNHSLLLWAWGSATGTAAVYAGANLTLNSPSATTAPVRRQVNGGLTGGGVELFLTGTGTITLAGLQAIVVPTTRAAAYTWRGKWASGQGHSGCDFTMLEQSDYSAAMDKVGITAEMVEVGQWL